MPRIRAVFVALAFVCASSAACAGDFMPRATAGYAAVGDDPGPRSASVDVGSAAPMSEAESPGPVRASAPSRSGHVGVDGNATADNHTAATAANDGEDKATSAAPANPHKSRALRWQSLLPGVMK